MRPGGERTRLFLSISTARTPSRTKKGLSYSPCSAQMGTFGNSPSWCDSDTKELRHEEYGHLSCSWRRSALVIRFEGHSALLANAHDAVRSTRSGECSSPRPPAWCQCARAGFSFNGLRHITPSLSERACRRFAFPLPPVASKIGPVP